MVVAPTTTDAVRFTGGWLFDWVMAGWEAMVLTTDHTNSRPLRILGASPIDLECALTSSARDPWPQSIAVDARLCESDARVRRVVWHAIDKGVADIRLWGDQCWKDFDGQVNAVQYRLSVAARAFKSHALAATAAQVDPIGVTETFRMREPRSRRT